MSRKADPALRDGEGRPISTLSDWIKYEMRVRDWSSSDLLSAIEEASDVLEDLGENDLIIGERKGISAGNLSNYINGKTNEPGLRSLRLLAMAFGVPFRRPLLALGYNPDEVEALTSKRKQVLAMVEAAPDDVIDQLAGFLELTTQEKRATNAFMETLRKELRRRE